MSGGRGVLRRVVCISVSCTLGKHHVVQMPAVRVSPTHCKMRKIGVTLASFLVKPTKSVSRTILDLLNINERCHHNLDKWMGQKMTGAVSKRLFLAT